MHIPSNWKLLPLGKLLLDAQYGTNEPAVEGGNTKVVGMKDIKNGKIIIDNLTSTELSEGDRKKYLLNKGDILINRTNSYDLVGKVGIINTNDEAAFASYLVRLVADRKQVEPEYLNYWLDSSIAQSVIKRIATKAISQANINPTELKKHCLVPLPPRPERASIVDIFSTWDAAIEKTEQLIKAKEIFYTWSLSQLISNSNYPRVHIRDFAIEVLARNQNDEIDLVLSVTNKNGFVLPEDQFERRIASSDLSNYKIVTNGQYAYNPSRINVGSIARLDKWDKGVLSPMYVVFELDQKKVKSDYFLHWLASYEAKQRIVKSVQGSVRETVNFTDLGAILIPLPSMYQQATVVNRPGFAGDSKS
jgi:type I restriction enzyme S subunit